MTSGSLEAYFPSVLPERWAKLVGPEGVQALADVGHSLDRSPAQKAMMTPSPEVVLRAFHTPPESVRCIIFGQDPYPGQSHASGLAFSVEPTVTTLPPSLRNIRGELQDDLALRLPTHGDLSPWADEGSFCSIDTSPRSWDPPVLIGHSAGPASPTPSCEALSRPGNFL